MSGIKGEVYTWNKGWIEFKAPTTPGVYCIRDKDGNVIYVGKGKVRDRLLSHWNHENPVDQRMWSHAPATFSFELTAHPARREAELIRDLKPSCNRLTHSKFFKLW